MVRYTWHLCEEFQGEWPESIPLAWQKIVAQTVFLIVFKRAPKSMDKFDKSENLINSRRKKKKKKEEKQSRNKS